MNLGWKLAATVHGHAPDGLLDTYTRERHPIGAGVLDWTRAQAAVMRPGPHGQAIQSVMRDLLGTRDGTTHVSAKVSGSSIRYDLGGGHPLTGRSAPDLQLEDGTRLGELLRGGRGLALDLTADRRLPDAATARPGRLRHTAGTAKNDLGPGAVLVRPDGFVAWAGDRDFDPSRATRCGTSNPAGRRTCSVRALTGCRSSSGSTTWAGTRWPRRDTCFPWRNSRRVTGRLLAPLAEAGTELILIEPFLLPVHGVVEAGAARVGPEERTQWRADLNPKIQAVRELARPYGAQLLPADSMFTELSTATGPEYWAEDGVHPTPAGHAALAAAWLRLVACPRKTSPRRITGALRPGVGNAPSFPLRRSRESGCAPFPRRSSPLRDEGLLSAACAARPWKCKPSYKGLA
ncbi:FAD-dependent oxidoreductase [Streptomyces chrestomyceticus JCM 4735]|uniref:FAD-dependent oxidoreductase n=1 Tax=Streptomyces chrestomyceticus JCM 4735 TaxID=1306181 RepID=A0A7U9L4B0_9ACTN|nr:FAD-dependent oxidoreductase [Streptomyces chrestomyceticus JCM 4735]